MLERIREIRASERRYYQKITDIYAECSADYDPKSETTQQFFKTVQNMMHWAVTHQTAAEIIYSRADAEMPHMGLTITLISISIMFACTPMEEQANVKMDYILDWQTDHLHVSLVYTPTEADSTILHYGEISYGGQADIFSCVKNFKGENCTLLTDSAAREIKLYYEGTPSLRIAYDMEYDLEDEKLNCPRELFRPNTDKDFLYVQGLNLYLHKEGEKDYLQRVKWLNKPDFPTFCMYNEDGNFDTKVAPQSEFYYKFILGDRRLHVDTFELYGVTNYMVTAPLHHADFNRADIKDFFQKVKNIPLA